MAAITATLGSITFGPASRAADADGDKYTLRELDGWATPDVDLHAVEKPLADGAVIAYVRYTGRTVTLSGHIIASNQDGVWRARKKLADVADAVLAAAGTLTVAEPAHTYTLSVRLAAPLRIRQVSSRVAEYELSVYAASPAKTLVP